MKPPAPSKRRAASGVLRTLIVGWTLAAPSVAAKSLDAQVPEWERGSCASQPLSELRRDPTPVELRCRFGVSGPGRFGLLSYADLPVYQPATPMPGTHLFGVPGHARPTFMESFEQWEWRVLRTHYGPEALVQHRGIELLDPSVRSLIERFEARLTAEGVRFGRRETWRSPVRQAYLFQQGRSRPGALATTTLTSWHSQVDAYGNPSGRAVDYDVPARFLPRFHEIAAELGLLSFGHESHDPGHVFLPPGDVLDPLEIAVLRTLPRVPEVTLSTGLPVDRQLPLGGRDELRARTMAFITAPFLAMPMARVTPPLEAPVREGTISTTVEARAPRLAAGSPMDQDSGLPAR